jgi:ribosomal-protein-alanine N-acetyltransferase
MTHIDIDSVYRIEVEAFSTPWTYESLEQELDNTKALYIVAEIDGNIVGYAGLWKIFEDGYITNIAVDSKYRRKGIGTGLIENLIKAALISGLKNFTLEVRESNIEAVLLYRKLGFIEKGKRKNFYTLPKEDAIIMWLNDYDIMN